MFNNYRMIEEVKKEPLNVVQDAQSLKAMTEWQRLNAAGLHDYHS